MSITKPLFSLHSPVASCPRKPYWALRGNPIVQLAAFLAKGKTFFLVFVFICLVGWFLLYVCLFVLQF
jgi:hypothetical protein